MSTVEQEVHEPADSLPEGTSANRVTYGAHVGEQIVRGETDITEGRTIHHGEVNKRFTRA